MTTQTQATGSKGKKKNKEILKVSLHEFNNIDTPVGHSVVNVKVGTGLDWAATMANYDDQSADTKQIIVPSAPRSYRGPNIDFDSLPNEGPFKVSLFNLPLSVEDKDINDRFFQGIKILNIEQGKQTTTVELATKDDLYQALCKDGVTLKGKNINVCIFGEQPQQSYNSGGYGNRGGYGDRYDRYGSDSRYNDRPSNNYGSVRNDRYGDRPNYNRDSFNNSGGPSSRPGPGSFNSYNRTGGNFGNDRGNFRDRDNRNSYAAQSADEPPRDEPNNWRERSVPAQTPPQPLYNNQGSRNSSFSRQESHQQHYQQSSHQQQYRSDPHYQNRYNNQQSSNYNHPYSSQNNPSDNNSGPSSETRPKLQLKPRSIPLRQDEPPKINAAIFGQAKPSNKPYEKILEVEKKLKSVTIKDKPLGEEQPSNPEGTDSSQEQTEAEPTC